MRWTSRVPTRSELRDAKIEAVLRMAAMSFNRRGFHGTSLDEIAQQLGVTKAALYYYFPNKQAVLKACFESVMKAAFENLDRARREGTNGRDKLRIVLGGFLEHIIADLSVAVLIMEDDALTSDDSAAVKKQRDRFERALRDLVREGIQDGSIVECDPKLAVFALLGAVNWVPRWFKSDGSWSSKELATALWQFLERALSPTPPKLMTKVGTSAGRPGKRRRKLRSPALNSLKTSPETID